MALGENVLGFVVKARDEASQTIDHVENKVTGLGSKTKVAFGVMGAAAGGLAGAGLGILGERTLELDSSMAKLRAETGLNAQQTGELSKEVINLSKSHLQSQGAITGVMSDLISLQGVEASNKEELAGLTNQYLDFATATGTDAAANVAAFDDILDGFNLTAKDAGPIMDKLVLSHQKFGLDVAGSEAALAKLAPTFKALNLDVDDGIGLLNLFAASGVDSAASSAAMSKATAILTDSSAAGVPALEGLAAAFGMTADQTKGFLSLEPAGKFQMLITQLETIEDPAKRAEAAMALFGAKGGAAMASALSNANGGLSDFKVKTEEASGAAKKAGDEIEGSFSNRMTMFKNEVLGGAQALSQDFAPGLMLLGTVGPQAVGAVGAIGGAMTGFASSVGVAAKAIGLALLTPPLGVIVAIIAVLALLYLAWTTNFGGIQEKTTAFATWMLDKMTSFKDGFVGVFGAVRDFLASTWPMILLLISGPFMPLVALATDAFGIRTALVEAFRATLEGIQGMWGGLVDIVRGPVNSAIGYINRLIGAWNGLQFSVGGGSFLGVEIPRLNFGTPDLPFIPMLANGGIVTKPTLAMIGEAGPEAVIPLNRMGSGSGVHIENLIVQVTEPLGTPEQVANAVLRGIEHLKSTGALAA